MKVMIDTNILFSSALNENGTPYKAYLKAVTYPNQAIICEQNVDELYRVFRKKFPDKMYLLDRFFSIAMMSLDVVKVPVIENTLENKIRDITDKPILRTAIHENVDILLTGDKDFLEADITALKIMTASQFLQL